MNVGLLARLQRGGSRPQWQLDQGYRKFQDLTDALERNAQAQKQVLRLSPFCCSRGQAVCYEEVQVSGELHLQSAILRIAETAHQGI